MTTFWSQKALSLTDWFWNVIYAHTALSLNASLRPSAFLIHPLLTILCAGPQQVDDVLVFANNLHHFHLGDEIWQVLLCGVGYKSNIDEHTYILIWQGHWTFNLNAVRDKQVIIFMLSFFIYFLVWTWNQLNILDNEMKKLSEHNQMHFPAIINSRWKIM